MTKLTSVLIPQELIFLTGDIPKGILLNYFITAFGLSNSEESWVTKTSKQISDETLLKFNPSTLRNHLKILVNNNWLFEQKCESPNKTIHYRLNLKKLNDDLQEKNWTLHWSNIGQEKVSKVTSFASGDNSERKSPTFGLTNQKIDSELEKIFQQRIGRYRAND